MQKFAQELRQKADPIWEASFQHPFIQELREGTLSEEKMKHYVLQDGYYLSHFARVQSLAGAKAEDFITVNRMASHAQGSYEAEMAMHQKFTTMLQITGAEQDAFEAAPTAHAYTSHLYRAAHFGSTGVIIAALLPCYWLYYEIGERLQGAEPNHPVYEEWIAAYGGDWFKELVDEQIGRLNAYAVYASAAERKMMEEYFMISSRYELGFWEMAYTLETWDSAAPSSYKK